MEKTYRVSMVGDAAVGKTSLIASLMGNEVNGEYKETVGAAFHSYSDTYEGKNVTIQLWDTAGQERYRSLGQMYYRSTIAVILVYDITNSASFDNLSTWLQSFRDVTGPRSLAFVVANKTDLEPEDPSIFARGQQFAKDNGFLFFKTSAKTGENVKMMFNTILEVVAQTNAPSIVTSNLNPSEKSSAGCC
ncbi:small GTP-binding protein, putative [Trichomonas vaginalis G3]|uniref:Small GTP-binding protein, putative n=1 Tax=Trichomonas vaginalis (strain ATCC PRA-98 / G3) TaxID=412133 RepID=A2F1X0_TRIV3|nr:retrograde vesicle-mediated transport, Golgi to ER [Trichomonas vaginalis G3]EAY01115.1 small GTP-binding protein, putative [Trichomonas vaginalis G3]KAI5517434.1 retrograde vesicle-mediated transport, Golgi to ER [Trichomonas vaginalis G3]|eukprot:XP_001313967.1 small GTP-binding protein [Trichomonas vaginalis G3]